jgi:phosphoenolpyruvate-protein kinase (PTS system EI component)
MALAGGAVAGHAAIVARALGLPLVVELGAALLEVATDSMLVVDGGRGCVLVDPDADELRALSHPRP